ncbi:nucleoporin-related [Striga asiatica]|uniref:Nucleoporin-related n=1 Tax=Striga asiatica TaxID=4170 RepID=A0A5A7RHI5_STRAF|nr:nucleoporin-related [Striga asiatica]
MATAEEGGATVHPTSSPYGGGGAGGKFRKKPFRRPTTPYDRPPTALRGNNDNNSSWLKKLVVEPASKLISYGAERFFAPLLRKRLPPPPPPQPPEEKADVSDGIQGPALDGHDGPHEPVGGDCSQPINSSSSNDISELEQLLKQRTFTRSEIVHLRELLQSRAAEVSPADVGQKKEDTASDYARDHQFASGLLEENRNGRNRSSTLMTTPIFNSKVVEDGNASPTELAKAYMGSRPSKVSPSVLGIRNRVGKGDTELLSSLPSASGLPIMASTMKTHGSMAATDNGFITPRSRGRSAIYNMARTPYSKFHLTSSLKENGINRNGYAGPGPSTSSSFLSPVDMDEKINSRPMSLKRRSSVLDDELGSVGPIRRIRQKHLLASGLHSTTHGVRIGSHAKQKSQLIGEQSHKAPKAVGENDNESVPISNYPRVPSKSSEVASKILQHLEKMTPKEKSSESKFVDRKEKSRLTLTPNMLSGQALRSMEDVNSSKLLDVQDDHMLGDKSNITLADAHDFSMQKKEKIEENGPKEHVDSLDKWHPVLHNDSVVSLKASMPSTSASGSTVKTGASHPQKKRAFRMSAQEDFSEQDDDTQRNGPVPIATSENQGPTEATLTDSKTTPSEEPKLVKPSMREENQSALPLISRNTSAPNFGDVTSGEVSTVVSLSTTDEIKEASQSAFLIPSVAASDKPKDASNVPLFSFSSKVVEKIASVPSDVVKEVDNKIEVSSRLLIFKGSNAFLFNSSASSGSTSIFGLTAAAEPSIPAGGPVFKFGASVDPATSVPVASTASVSQAAESKNPGTNKSETLTNAAAAFTAAASSASSSTSFGFGSSVSFPSVFGTASQDASSTKAVPSAPAFNLSSSSTTLFSSSSGSQPSFSFGLTPPPASSSDTSTVKFGANSTEATAVSSTTSTTPGIFTFGPSSSSTSSTGVGSTPEVNFSDSSSSGSAPVSTTTPTTTSANNVFSFGGNSSLAPSSSSNPFAANWQNPKPSPIFGSSNAFAFGASSSSVFNMPSSFSFTAAASTPAPAVFGGADQMDSMAEDHPVQQQQQQQQPIVFGQSAPTPTPTPAFGFGQPSSFVFGGQPNQVGGAVTPQNPNPFQASGSLEFNAGGSFSLGSGGGDRSGRKIVKISRSKNRKK